MTVEEKNHNSIITCILHGGLGNQLFIIAATLGYAWDNNATPLFSSLYSVRTQIYYKDKLFSQLNTKASPRPLLNYFKENIWFRYEKIPLQKDLIINGHFQSWKYFHHHQKELFKIF